MDLFARSFIRKLNLLVLLGKHTDEKGWNKSKFGAIVVYNNLTHNQVKFVFTECIIIVISPFLLFLV